jgi:ABC-type multidrug transport system fused ATPase/permease subunit
VGEEAWPPLASGRNRISMVLGEKRRTVFALAVCSVGSGLTEAAILVLVAQLATTAAKGNGPSKISFIHFHATPDTLFALALGLTLVKVALQAPLSVLPARIAADVQSRLRHELLGVFTRASWEVQSSDREGYFQETMTGQVAQATGGALQTTALVISSFQFTVLLASALALNPIAATVILGAAILLFVALRPLNALAVKISREWSAAQLEYAGGVSEAGRLAEEAQVFGVGASVRERVGRLVAAAQRLFFRSQLVNRLAPSLYQSAVLVILVGGLFVLYKQGPGHFAGLGAVILIIVRAGNYGQQVTVNWQGLRTSLPFIDRLRDTARRYAESIRPDGERELQAVSSMAFDGVTFGYRPERPVLKDISFRVDAGEAIGIVGPSGAGKSTLIQILLHLREPDEGAYLVNDMRVEEFRSADWHKRVSYVPQQPRLLHATVAENIRFLRDLDDETVERAAKLARIHEDIVSWPDRYETLVGPRVDAVSGGQQQRICLARALAGRPEVLVLDEPTSALDPQSERLIQASLEGLQHEMTLFIIAHRMSTLDICDRVMVIVDGRIAAFDRTELLQQNNSYYRSASLLATGATTEAAG